MAASSAYPEDASRPARLRDGLEIASAFTLLEIALWTPKPIQLWFGVAMLALVVILTLVSRRAPVELGLTGHGFRQSLVVLPYAGGACAILLFVGWSAGWLHAVTTRVGIWHGLGYVVWAFEQQFMAQSFYFMRFASLFGSRRAVWITAVLFAAAHIPNPVLLPATFAAGLGFSFAFERHRNLYPIAAAHALLGLALSAALPIAW